MVQQCGVNWYKQNEWNMLHPFLFFLIIVLTDFKFFLHYNRKSGSIQPANIFSDSHRQRGKNKTVWMRWSTGVGICANRKTNYFSSAVGGITWGDALWHSSLSPRQSVAELIFISELPTLPMGVLSVPSIPFNFDKYFDSFFVVVF